MSKALIVIPARMASTRFPNKPLALIKGERMIERVWKLAKASKHAHDIVIATDDDELAEVVSAFGQVVMTSSTCKTGTDRVAEVARHPQYNHYDLYFSLQGDAVLTPPWVIDHVLEAMINNQKIAIATPAIKLCGKAREQFIQSKQRGSSSGTCVVFDNQYRALYFSKTLIPFSRDQEHTFDVYRHIGLYGYTQAALLEVTALPESTLERTEKLEQLRALEHGIPIQVVSVDYRGRTHGSVDQPSDVEDVERIIEQEGELLACLPA